MLRFEWFWFLWFFWFGHCSGEAEEEHKPEYMLLLLLVLLMLLLLLLLVLLMLLLLLVRLTLLLHLLVLVLPLLFLNSGSYSLIQALRAAVAACMSEYCLSCMDIRTFVGSSIFANVDLHTAFCSQLLQSHASDVCSSGGHQAVQPDDGQAQSCGAETQHRKAQSRQSEEGGQPGKF